MDNRTLEKLSKPVADIYLETEEKILLNVASYLAKNDSLLDGDIQAWQTQSLNSLESLNDDNIRLLSSNSGKTAEEVRKTLEKAGYDSLLMFEDDLQKQVKRGRLNSVPDLQESGSLLRVLEGYERQALNTLNLVNTTLLSQSEQIYLDIVNRTTAQVLTGNTTPRLALRQVSSEWAERGVPALIDKAGKRWSTEAYVNMVIRSTSNNVANDMQDARFDEYGQDLVEVSSHNGARPLCAPYQGRIFSRSGNSTKYPALSSTSIGEPAGLFGVNCGHVKYPYFEGMKRTYQPMDRETNDRQYENSQKQRYLERRIRDAKREQSMLKAMGDREGAELAKRKVLDRQANQRSFINSTGRTRRYDREQIG